jgi:hypothetical protein
MAYRKSSKRKSAPRRKLLAKPGVRGRYIPYMATGAALGMAAASRFRTAKAASEFMKKKRSSSSSESSSAVSRSNNADQGMQDYRKSSSKFGVKQLTAKLAKRLTVQTINTTVYTIHNYGAWNRGEGTLNLAALQTGILGTAVRMPVHLWDLTAVPQGTGAGILYPAVFYDLNFSNETSTGTVGWTTHVNNASATATGLDQRASGNTINYNPTVTYASTQKELVSSGIEGGPGASSYLEKVRATLVLNGPQQRATKWCIQLVQLSDEVIPGVNPDSSNTPTAFWQSMAKPYGFSPLETGPRRELTKHIKYLKTMTFSMDSPENSEDHLTARMRHVDFSAYLNRKLNYRWGHTNDLVNLNVQDVPRDNTTSSFSSHVHPKARIYLMIRALCTYQGPSVAYSNTIYPSYDIKMDITHKSMD